MVRGLVGVVRVPLAGWWAVSLPIVTRTVLIEAPDVVDDDPVDVSDTWTTVADTDAHIAGASGNRQGAGREQVDAVLYVNLGVPVSRFCRVTDRATGFIYMVQWVQSLVGVGLDHTKAGLTRIAGEA